jgi:hypothetical protein
MSAKTARGEAQMLFAREAELARIDALLEGARQGRGGALVMYGEPGVGKTALALDARERAADMLVLSVQGIEAEAELPFAGLMLLLSPVIDGIDGLPLPQRDALAGALGLGPPWRGDRFAAYAGTLGLLAGAAEHNAIAVVADDAHWLDRASAEALLFCARRLQRERVCMLVTARTEEMPLGVPVDVPRLHLSGLDAASAIRLVERDSRVSVSRAVATAIHRATGGNPLALRALADGLNGAQLSGTEPLPAALPVGHELEVAFGRRIAGLPEKTKTALLLVAASDSGSVEELAGAFRHCSVDLSALEPAEEAGVATIGGGVVEFCHPLIRSAAYEGVSGPERRRAHAALAGVLRSEQDRTRRAWHLALAAIEPDEAIATELEAAAAGPRAR